MLGLLLWACLSPLRYPHREKSLDLGSDDSLALSEVRLTLGVQDVLVLTNSSRSSQVFGQLRLLPGHEFRLPFEQAGASYFGCRCAFRGELLVRVVEPPDPGWARLRWRIAGLVESVRTLRASAPFPS